MKHALVVVLLTFCGAAFGQVNTLPPAPCDSINLRLELAGEQMRKAAWNRNTSIVVGVVGGFFTVLTADRSKPGYDQEEAIAVAAATGFGFGLFQWLGADHDRKAARHLMGN